MQFRCATAYYSMLLQDIFKGTVPPVAFTQLPFELELVRQIQIRLKALQLPAGKVDGLYGSSTAVALSMFCEAYGLSQGKVDQTLAKLLIEQPTMQGYDPVKNMISPEMVSSIIGCSLVNAQKYLPGVMSALQTRGILDKLVLTATICTIGTEVPDFAPIKEFVAIDVNTSRGGHPFDLYDNFLGNGPTPDGEKYCGKGFIQLTGKDNYRHFGAAIGHPLEAQPDLALDPKISAEVLAQFFLENRVVPAAHAKDWFKVRARINGLNSNGEPNGLQHFQALVDKLIDSLL